MQDFVFFSPKICSCVGAEIRIIVNINNPQQKLTAKIYKDSTNEYYQTENRILTILTAAHNNENILHLLPQNNIHLILDEGYPLNTRYLIFDFYAHGKLCKYLYCNIINHNQLSEDMAKFMSYKLIRAVLTIHQNHIVHGQLNINNIMLNNNFEPIIIHFKESVDGINDNNQYLIDYKGLAEILLILMSRGKYIKIKENGRIKMNNMTLSKEQLWKAINLEYHIRVNFKEIINALLGNNIINLNVLLQNSWLQGVAQNQAIETETRNYFNDLHILLNDAQNTSDNVEQDFSEYIGGPDNDISLFNNANNIGNMKGVPENTIENNFEKKEIRKTSFRPKGILYEYLLIKLENYYDNSKFVNNYMLDLYYNIPNVVNLPGLTVEMDNSSDEVFLSFDTIIKELKKDNKDDEETKEMPLIINLELIELDDNIEMIKSNKRYFYLLFNYIQGEIYYYYQYVEIIKLKAREILKKLFKSTKK